jgi:hypothetical protein
MAFERLDYLARTVLSRMNTDELGGSYCSASPEEKPAGANAPAGSPGSADDAGRSTRAAQNAPGMGKGRTRSGDGWTVRKPGKTAERERPAKLIDGKVDVKPSPATGRPVLLINNKCLPARPKASMPLLGAGSHLRLVGGEHHARSLSGAST